MYESEEKISNSSRVCYSGNDCHFCNRYDIYHPGREFARVKNEATGKMIVDATSFTWVEQCPVSFLKIPNYIVKALAGSSLIWMTIFSAASIEVILATGAFDAAINIMIHKYKSSESCC